MESLKVYGSGTPPWRNPQMGDPGTFLGQLFGQRVRFKARVTYLRVLFAAVSTIHLSKEGPSAAQLKLLTLYLNRQRQPLAGAL